VQVWRSRRQEGSPEHDGEERSVRAKKAAKATAEKGTTRRLAREGIKRERNAAKRS
jgi:hypothetical protein